MIYRYFSLECCPGLVGGPVGQNRLALVLPGFALGRQAFWMPMCWYNRPTRGLTVSGFAFWWNIGFSVFHLVLDLKKE